jgi:hypothetical protein
MADEYSILDTDGFTMLDAEGFERLEDDGGPCCCEESTTYCIQVITASYVCGESGTGSWSISSYTYTGAMPSPADTWVDLSPGVRCSGKRMYRVYGSYNALGPIEDRHCPAIPDPIEPDAPAEPCAVCFDITCEDYGQNRTWINGTLCDDTTVLDRGPVTLRYRFSLCGTSGDDLVPGSFISADGEYDWVTDAVGFAYQPSTDTFYIYRNFLCNPSWETVSITATPATTAGEDFLPVDHSMLCQNFPAPPVGTWSECLGRNFLISDVILEQYSYTINVAPAKVSCVDEPDSLCYYTKLATCTLVNPSPEVWVWIPGTVTASCGTAPGTLDVWTLVSGTTWQIIREGEACTGTGDCTGGLSSETPTGVVACP